MKKKHIIKIPNSVKVFYSNKKNMIIFKSLKKQSSLKPNVKIFFKEQEKKLYISSISTNKKLKKNKAKIIKNTTVALAKQKIFEVLTTTYLKLNFVGLGYRVLNADIGDYENALIMLKLGFSKPIFFKASANTKIFNLKLTKSCVYGSFYLDVTQVAAQIRYLKPPEPYKGKGILYEGEKVVLRPGKKT